MPALVSGRRDNRPPAGGLSRPCSVAAATATVRPDTPSLAQARSRCVFTVASLMNRSRPISALVRPRAAARTASARSCLAASSQVADRARLHRAEDVGVGVGLGVEHPPQPGPHHRVVVGQQHRIGPGGRPDPAGALSPVTPAAPPGRWCPRRVTGGRVVPGATWVTSSDTVSLVCRSRIRAAPRGGGRGWSASQVGRCHPIGGQRARYRAFQWLNYCSWRVIQQMARERPQRRRPDRPHRAAGRSSARAVLLRVLGVS